MSSKLQKIIEKEHKDTITKMVSSVVLQVLIEELGRHPTNDELGGVVINHFKGINNVITIVYKGNIRARMIEIEGDKVSFDVEILTNK